MKKKESIRTLLGISQEHIAMLLRVSRTQWSMYESGKRNLPAEAKEKLAKMIDHVEKSKAKASKRPSKEGKQETSEKLKTLLEVNEYQQWQLEKKVTAMEKKQTVFAAALHSIDYLENHTDKEQTHMKEMSKVIQNRANKERLLQSMPALVSYQIRQQVLQYEGELLKAALEKF